MPRKGNEEKAVVEDEQKEPLIGDPSESNEDTVDSPRRLCRKRKLKSRSPSTESLVNDASDSEEIDSFPSVIVKSRVPLLREGFWSQGTITIAVILVLAVVGLLFCLLTVPTSRPNLIPAFAEKLELLKKEFYTQPGHNWSIIKSAFVEVLNSSDYPYGPATLIILASRNDQKLAKCFSERLASSLAKVFDPNEKPIVFDGAKLAEHPDSRGAKRKIAESVNGRDNFVMQFNALEEIDSYTASIFFSLCDYVNSPFKERAIFIFTIHTQEETTGRGRKEYDKMAERVLKDAWNELDFDKSSALIARLTGNTILLHKQSRRVC